MHNQIAAILLGKSYNDINAEMDRAAKTMGRSHREVGHDIPGLIHLMFMFSGKYTKKEIMAAWALHKYLDGVATGLGNAARNKVKSYGKKTSNAPKPVRDIRYGITREMKRLLPK